MFESGLDFENCSHISTNEYQKAQRGNSCPELGDVLFSKDGTVGKVHVVKERNKFSVLSSIAILRPDPTVLDSDYLGHVLRWPTTLEQTSKKQTGSALRRIILSDLKKVEIPLSPLEEQKRIAAILDKAHAIRRKRQQVIKLADDFLRATFLDIFGDPVTNPKGWVRSELGKLIKVKSGNFLPANKMCIGTIPVYGGNGINGYHDQYMFDKSIIVIGRVGVYCGVIHKTETKSWITDNALYVAEKIDAVIDLYLEWSLRMANLNQYASQAGQPLISGGRIYPVEINLPPISLQKKFEKFQTTQASIKEKVSITSHKGEELFNSLTQRAFRGGL